MRVASLLGLTLTLAGCSLDLDRLRARDVGLESDARTSPIDAALDATVDPSLDAAHHDASDHDAGRPRDTLGVLRTHPTGMIDAFAAGRDERGAWLVLGGAQTRIADVTRSDCDARSAREDVVATSGKAVAVGDLDDDGDIDVIAANGDGFVAIRTQPDGSVAASVLVPHGQGGVMAIELGDLDDDNVPDVVIFGDMRDIAWFTQTAGAVFEEGAPLEAAPPDATILDGTVLDLDGDGIDDVARLLQRAVPTGSSHEILRGTGGGSFADPEHDAVGRTTRLRATRREATLASGTNDELFVTTRAGTVRWDLPPTTRAVRDMAFAQVHGDADDELVVVYVGGVVMVYDVSSLGELREWRSVELDGVDTSSEALVVLDVDGDGFDELFVRNGLAIAILGLRPSDCR